MEAVMLNQNDLNNASIDYENNFVTLRKNLKFSNKTLEEWTIRLNVAIPEDASFEDIKKTSYDLDKCFSLAHNNFIVAQGVLSFLKRTLEIDTINAHTEVEVEGGGVRRTIIEKDRLASSKVKEAHDKVVVAEFVCDFWKEQVRLLERRSKILEQIFWSLKNQEDKQ